MSIFEVTFDRIGRNHDVPPLRLGASHAEDMEFKLYHYGRRFLASRGVDVVVDWEKCSGMFLAGMHNGGTFTFAEVQP